MKYMAHINPPVETFAKIKVVGVGGGGGSAINRMITSKIRGIEFIAMNTDVQALHHSQAAVKLHIGKNITRGLGAGMDPEVGYRAAEESEEQIREILKDADMVFITFGLGGGTGSGAGPKIAAIAKDMGALTVAVVTRPFVFEGAQRKAIADQAHEDMSEAVDTMITIPNDRILQIIDRKTSLLDAFEIVDDVLRQGVQGISELITVPGLINVDFADVRSIMMNRGSSLMGIGKGQGENRAADAAKAAIASPLLEVSIDGAKGILFTITGGSNLGMYEVSEAAQVITQSADPDAKVIFGAIIDETMKDEVKLTVIATGFDSRIERPRAKSVLASGSYMPVRPSESLERLPFTSHAAKTTPENNAVGGTQTLSSMRKSNLESRPVAPKRSEETQPAERQPHVQTPSYSPVKTQRTEIPQPATVPDEKKEDDDLEIPAFIRKKMM